MIRCIISDTGTINGRGSEPWKWVGGLTKAEKSAVREGSALVFIRDNAAWSHTQSGWKIVLYVSGKYVHREPSADERAAFNRWMSRKGGEDVA